MKPTQGKYHSLCEEVHHRTAAEGTIVAVFNGNLGNGFSAVGSPEFCLTMVKALRILADQMEAKDLAQRGLLS